MKKAGFLPVTNVRENHPWYRWMFVVVCLVLPLSNACEEDKLVAGLNEGLTQDGVTVTVTHYELAYLQLDGEAGTEFSETPALAVHVLIKNGGSSQISYLPQHTATSGDRSTIPLLFVDPGDDKEPTQNIKGVHGKSGLHGKGQVTNVTGIDAGTELTDYYVFETPPDGTGKLLFTFPGKMLGLKQEMIFRFDYSATEPVHPQLFDSSSPAILGPIAITIDSAQVEWVKLKDDKLGEGYLDRPLLVVRYSLENKGQTDLQYFPKHSDSEGKNNLTLRDVDNKHYFTRARIPEGVVITGQVRTSAFLQPGVGSVRDLACFLPPGKEVDEVVLYFPGKLLSLTGLVRISIPYKWENPPKPADLQGIHEINRPAHFDSASVTVTKVEHDWIGIEGGKKNQNYLKKPHLIIHYTIDNTGSSTLTYDPRHQEKETENANRKSLTLRDADSLIYPKAQPPEGAKIVGLLEAPVQIKPGDSFDDKVIFVAPDEEIKELTFYFPGDLISQTGMTAFRIPFQPTAPAKPPKE